MSKFKPHMYQKDIFSINYDKLKKDNIKVIVMDLDNTIATVKEIIPRDDVKKLFKKLSKDFKIIIASNNTKNRVQKMCQDLSCDYYYNLLKPSKKLYKILKEKYHVEMKEVCVIGDQLVTDVFLGNRIGALTILVEPLGNEDLKITYLNRVIEKLIRKKINLIKGSYYEKS